MNRLRVRAAAIIGGGLVCLLSAAPCALWAQSNRLSADVKRDYRNIRDIFIRAAEKMPEENYGFKPSPDVRSFGQQVAHVADDQYNLCAPAKGETRKAAYTQIEDTLSRKADLVGALKEAFAYCDGAYDALTDASGAEAVKMGKMGRTRFGMLNWNLWHTWEHYGNVVVYLRMKGLVPPTSERMQMK
ncbi:MAG: DinB family protein [Acidobacteriia bacterium]|nr:DinB family protein [Terriglobia bacterium]